MRLCFNFKMDGLLNNAVNSIPSHLIFEKTDVYVSVSEELGYVRLVFEKSEQGEVFEELNTSLEKSGLDYIINMDKYPVITVLAMDKGVEAKPSLLKEVTMHILSDKLFTLYTVLGLYHNYDEKSCEIKLFGTSSGVAPSLAEATNKICPPGVKVVVESIDPEISKVKVISEDEE